MDDGLNIRKSALICFETLLDVMRDQFESTALLHSLVHPSPNSTYILMIKDKVEIKFSAFQVLAKICRYSPGAVLGSLDQVVVVLTHLFNKARDLTMSSSKPDTGGVSSGSNGDGAPNTGAGADTDRLYELLRIACQVIVEINTRKGAASSPTPASSGAALANWKHEFIEKIVQKRPLLVSLMQTIQAERGYE